MNKYKINLVEFYYNGDENKFNAFLNSVIRDYINEDKISPDDNEKNKETSA